MLILYYFNDNCYLFATVKYCLIVGLNHHNYQNQDNLALFNNGS